MEIVFGHNFGCPMAADEFNGLNRHPTRKRRGDPCRPQAMKILDRSFANALFALDLEPLKFSKRNDVHYLLDLMR